MVKNGWKWIKMSFSFNIGLFRGFFGRKNECQKLPKSKANPLQKWLKMAIFSQFFLDQKTSGKLLKTCSYRSKINFFIKKKFYMIPLKFRRVSSTF